MINTRKYLPADMSFVEQVFQDGRKCAKCGVDSNTVSINNTMPARFYCIEHINLEVEDVIAHEVKPAYYDDIEAE